jgi:hypothetical protein
MFDIATKAQELEVEDAGLTVHIRDAENELAYYGGTPVEKDGITTMEGQKPVTWNICGINSKQFRAAEAWQRKVFRARGMNNPMTPAEEVAHQAEFIARCSRGFDGFADKGTPLTFSTPSATKILVAVPYIGRQLNGAMGDHAGFTKAHSLSSPS